jgi:hypothetical protein
MMGRARFNLESIVFENYSGSARYFRTEYALLMTAGFVMSGLVIMQ